MTDHADLSRRLALAIGWEPSAIRVVGQTVWIYKSDHPWKANNPPLHPWTPFDYRDPVIAWRVAERYNAFPVKTSETQWLAGCRTTGPRATGVYMHADTAAEAVARAVIGARG